MVETAYAADMVSCLEVLKSGGVILYPTDTIWGLGCDAANIAAVKRIVEIKERPPQKSFVVLVAGFTEMEAIAGPVPSALKSFISESVKPVSVICDRAHGLAPGVMADDGSVAVRVCRDEFCRQLIVSFGKPIVSTSANISGQPSPSHFAEISIAVKQRADYTVHFRQDETTGAAASSIIRWTDNGPVYIRR